jgi:thioredoxin reductase (NADPH)
LENMTKMLLHHIQARPCACVLLLAALACHTTAFFVQPKNARTFLSTSDPTRKVTQTRKHATAVRKAATGFTKLKMMEVIECDVAIVGGGPAGCTCALYTSRADLKTVIIDKNPAVGALAITSHIANYPGVDRSLSGQELLDQMRVQATQYGTEYIRAQVFMIDVKEEETGDGVYTKMVYTPDVTIKARSLVLATGAMGRAAPPFPGEDTYLGQGVSYCATCDGAFYRDSEVAVFGATVEAMEEALFLTKFASTVHWITSQDLERCLEKQNKVECNKIIDQEILEELLAQENVKHWAKTRLIGVEGDASGVTGVKVQKMYLAEQEIIPVEGAFIYGAGGGSKPITEFVQNKVELDKNGGVIVNEGMETSVKGVFAIGDIRNTEYKQVVVAAADGCIAAMSLEKFLKNRKTVKVDWIHK